MSLKNRKEETVTSFAIIRNQNHKIGVVPLSERHNERHNQNYSNQDIDQTRTAMNYHLKAQTGSYLDTFYMIREQEHLQGNLRLNGQKQSTVLCEFLITSDADFFDRIGAERTRKFFEDAYRFVCMKVGGEQYIVSATVHMDEKTPHMHCAFIPVVRCKDKKGQPCKRINCSEFWKGRDSYSRLQDEFHDWVTSHGYDLERGKKGSTAEHLSVEKYKLKKVQEQLVAAEKQAAEIKQIDDIRTHTLPFENVTLKEVDFEKLTAAAKGYMAVKDAEGEMESLKAEVSSLRNENESLKNANAALSGQLKELDHQFGAFYDSVADEVALQKENDRLQREVQNLGNQYHGVCRDLETVKAEKDSLAVTVLEQSAQIHTLTEKLTALQKIHKAIEEKYNRVMKFIESMNLKEKLDAFLHRGSQQHSR